MIRKVTGTIENYAALSTDKGGYTSMDWVVVRKDKGQERVMKLFVGNLLREFWAAKIQTGKPVSLYIVNGAGQNCLVAIECDGESLYDAGLVYSVRDDLTKLMSLTKKLLFICVILMVVLIGFIFTPIVAFMLYRQNVYKKTLDEPAIRREVAVLSEGSINGTVS